ncbi:MULTISPECIES: transposase [Pacificibacter]|uniref:transposase n=1 Tax=Pacificibacter TaxID=1042323 RepID=UPI00339D9663
MGRQICCVRCRAATLEKLQRSVSFSCSDSYAVSEVAEQIGISTKPLYMWKSQFAKSPRATEERKDEISPQI